MEISEKVKTLLRLYIRIKNCEHKYIKASFTQEEFDLLSEDDYVPYDVYLKVCPYTENKRMITHMPMCIINQPFNDVVDDWNNYWKTHVKYLNMNDVYYLINTPEKRTEFFKNKLDWDWNWDTINKNEKLKEVFLNSSILNKPFSTE